LFDIWENLKGDNYVSDFFLEDDILKIKSSHENWIYDIATGELKDIGDLYYVLNSGKKLFLSKSRFLF
jgi:hypothetical protein